jgi:6-phosphogluconate dehydrogenase (decarboxylating)
MSKIGFLGLGAMGSRMAANLLKAGHTVTVWNRSPEAEEALVASGARRASSPKAHSRRVSLRNDKKAWLVGRRIRNGRSSAAIKH